MGQSNSILKNRIVVIVMWFVLGLAIGAISIKLYSSGDTAIVRQIKKEEKVKRAILHKRIDSLEISERLLIKRIDSTSRANDSILKLREHSYTKEIEKLKNRRGEEINRINTVDSAYIDILSR